MSTVNPYAPPEARVDDVSDAPAGAEAVRREYIKHEAAVRSIGVLYYFGGVATMFVSIALLAAIASGASNLNSVFIIVMAIVYLGLGALSFFVGRGIRQLASWARTTVTVLSVIGLLGFPIGTLINGYILYLLHCAKGKRIFEPDYAAIVAATPFVKYRTSIVVWILLGLVVLTIAAVLIAQVGAR